MLFYVYRLRQSGERVDRFTLQSRGAVRGDFVFLPGPHEWYGRRVMLAKVLDPGGSKDLIPHLEHARILRVRRALMVAGNEVIVRGSKSKGDRYRQTWVCVAEPIEPQDWPRPPRDPAARGFDPADDDVAD